MSAFDPMRWKKQASLAAKQKKKRKRMNGAQHRQKDKHNPLTNFRFSENCFQNKSKFPTFTVKCAAFYSLSLSLSVCNQTPRTTSNYKSLYLPTHSPSFTFSVYARSHTHSFWYEFFAQLFHAQMYASKYIRFFRWVSMNFINCGLIYFALGVQTESYGDWMWTLLLYSSVSLTPFHLFVQTFAVFLWFYLPPRFKYTNDNKLRSCLYVSLTYNCYTCLVDFRRRNTKKQENNAHYVCSIVDEMPIHLYAIK